MLGTMTPYEAPKPIPRLKPPLYLVQSRVVALEVPDKQLTVGLPFCQVVDGMPQWVSGDKDYREIYHQLKESLSSLGLTFSALEGRWLYRAGPQQPRRTRMRKLSGLIINRMAGLAAAIHKADEPNEDAVKLYQLLPVDHRAVLEDHLMMGPHIADGYELNEHRDELIQIGLLTPIAVSGKTGSVAANMVAVHVHNAGATVPGDKRTPVK